jgi:hypothetical protein
VAVANPPTSFPPIVIPSDGGEEDDEDGKGDDGSGEDDRAPPPEPPQAPRRDVPQVRSIADVRALLRKGDADGALAGLLRLRRQRPSSASKASMIASLLGHLYFDRKWWTDALREYRFAVKMDGHARSDATLVNNTVRTLGDRATSSRARRLLVAYIGRSAIPALRRAARSGASPMERRNAQRVLSQLETRHRR